MREFHGLRGGAVLAFWGDIDAEHEQQFNEWYTHEHLPERVSIPGFLRARRYEATETSPSGHRFLTIYETETVDTLSSEAYLERLNNPTELTSTVVPSIKNMRRAVFRVTATLGQGVGGFLGSLQLAPIDREGTQSARERLADSVIPRLMERREITSAHLCEADLETTQVKDTTAEGRAAGTTSEPARWLLLIEATHEQALDAVDDVIQTEGLSRDGSAVARYRLMVSLSE